VEQHPRLGGVGGLGGGALGHHPEGVGAALAAGAAQVLFAGGGAEAVPGLGPVSLPQLLFEPFELP
jgi:hypothetical protein